ncbi:MAG: cytochrome c family protein [Pseudomonadota bacterium]
MNICPQISLLAAIGVILAACSGSSDPQPAQTEKPVEKPIVTPEIETADSAPAPASPPSATSAGDLAPEFANLPEPYRSANYSRGRRTFKLCASCHTLGEGGPNLVGPNLHGLFGREAGAVEGFRYSDAIVESGLVWSPEALEQWLASPRGFLPGNNMNFNGVRREADRTAVIAYIMVETGWQPSGE